MSGAPSSAEGCAPGSVRPDPVAEHYVRPPLVPREPPSRALAAWRYRVVATLLLVGLTIAVIVLFLHFSDITAEDPGLGMRPGVLQVAAAG